MMVPPALLSTFRPPSVLTSHLIMRMRKTSMATERPSFPMAVESPVSRIWSGVSWFSSSALSRSAFFSSNSSSLISPLSSFSSSRSIWFWTASGSAPSLIIRPHSVLVPTPTISMRP